jgi:antitoxin Phd
MFNTCQYIMIGLNSHYNYNSLREYSILEVVMRVLTAAEAKNGFGKMIDIVQREPVTIEKKGRAVAVVLSMEEYSNFELLENQWWGNKAEEAIKEEFMGTEESEKLMQRILNAKV